MDILEKIFHHKELKRLQVENEHLVEYNKKLSNQMRLKGLEVKNIKRIMEKEKDCKV